jgi:hypothetical protein
MLDLTTARLQPRVHHLERLLCALNSECTRLAKAAERAAQKISDAEIDTEISIVTTLDKGSEKGGGSGAGRDKRGAARGGGGGSAAADTKQRGSGKSEAEHAMLEEVRRGCVGHGGGGGGGVCLGCTCRCFLGARRLQALPRCAVPHAPASTVERGPPPPTQSTCGCAPNKRRRRHPRPCLRPNTPPPLPRRCGGSFRTASLSATS